MRICAAFLCIGHRRELPLQVCYQDALSGRLSVSYSAYLIRIGARPLGRRRPYECVRQLRCRFADARIVHLLAMFNGDCARSKRRIGDDGLQLPGERVDLGFLILPLLQFTVDLGATALADLRLDQVNGELVRAAPGGNEPCSDFACTDTGIADGAHDGAFRVKVVETIDSLVLLCHKIHGIIGASSSFARGSDGLRDLVRLLPGTPMRHNRT